MSDHHNICLIARINTSSHLEYEPWYKTPFDFLPFLASADTVDLLQ